MRAYDPRDGYFGYDPQTRTFSAMASDLAWPAGSACLEFQLKSELTGTFVNMERTGYERNADGDVVWFNYRSRCITSEDPTVDLHQTYYARIFND